LHIKSPDLLGTNPDEWSELLCKHLNFETVKKN